MKWWMPLVTAAVVFGAVGALVVVAVITVGAWRRFNPLVPDGKHTADDWAPGMHGPARKGQATS